LTRDELKAKIENDLKNKPKTDEEEQHAIKVKMGNKQFANTLVRKATVAGDFESSSSDGSGSFISESEESGEGGSLMVINIDLGKYGFHELRCLDTDNAHSVAKKFCRALSLGPKTIAKIEALISEK